MKGIYGKIKVSNLGPEAEEGTGLNLKVPKAMYRLKHADLKKKKGWFVYTVPGEDRGKAKMNPKGVPFKNS